MVAAVRCGDRVKLLLPDNPMLDGHQGVVVTLTEWGAHVATRVGAGQFRALYSEMESVEPKRDKAAYAKAQRDSREQGYTGDVCETCQGCRMLRKGPCLTCNDCGSSSGSCG